YLLTQVNNARDLLLTMSRAHAQMAHASEGIMPPLFGYDAMPGDANGLYLYYDSPRKLCDLLRGAIVGAGDHYGERVQVVEESCMKRGGKICSFAIRFAPISGTSIPSQPMTGASMPWASSGSQPGVVPDPQAEAQRRLADMIYALLPDADGMTLSEAQAALQARHPELAEASRPFIVLEALNHLHHAGWVATSANEPGDALGNRRYWRAKRIDA
ncbi:MAG: heme NO-binding domain-containing protein, partial [Chloroflexota bacterium]|nr:heme NO-binding domain-containing protein [Chloroflexota bacterium]